MSTLTARLSSFCDAVRAKKRWYHKILDDPSDLGLTWALEAGFFHESDSSTDDELVRDAIKELKDEARRIRFYDHTIRPSSAVPRRPVDFKTIYSDVRNALKYIKGAKYAIDKPDLRQHVGAFVSDDIIPVSLHHELVAELDALAAADPKDFHPGTYGKVQDLIHPSIYPFIAGVTYTNKPASLVQGKFETTMEANQDESAFLSAYSWIPSVFEVSEDGLDVHIKSYINGLGPREEYPVLYRLIEQVFLLVLPQLERTLGHVFQAVDSKSVQRWFARQPVRWDHTTPEEWQKILDKQALEKEQEEIELLQERQEKETLISSERSNISAFYDMEDSEPAVSHRATQLKVIVKAANYVLKPGQEYQGTWHLEGMPHERIVASAIYYYETDPEIEDEGLDLRYIRDLDADFPRFGGDFRDSSHSDNFELRLARENEDEEDVDNDEKDYPSDWEDSDDESGLMSVFALHKYIPIGAVPTTNFSVGVTETSNQNQSHRSTGRIITFPNWVQHKVTSVKNGASPTNPDAPIAKRKILCFFLVDDSDLEQDTIHYHGFSYSGLENLSVLTTADVPFQKRGDSTLHLLLPKACFRLTGKNLPAELVNHIIVSGNLGLSRELAEHHRRQLMQERKVNADTYPGGEYSLCEH